MTGTKASSFNMKQHPFDVQVMARVKATASPNPEPRTPSPEPRTLTPDANPNQVITGKLNLVSNIAYATDIPKVSINFTVGAMEARQTTDSVKAIYGGSDWEVLSATVDHKEGELEVP